ncbi:bacterioferritin comigratory protein [Leptospira interrogans]|nr:bacterioferritin comigratory protein [Leptospira interrogans serovar Copenhageni str. Fiocruz L1-130]KWV25938.1 bacterioferritin comigratory protein [Leptospira interrogans]KWV28449.1 bacterioferritin comigratory protein [Leptospira interrogans]OQM28952.1 bacterioferritin comigratory protein [Leptospira interrogans serovar Canicola str. Gui44]OQM33339.1 bacterioferritin comigratory protein [Leptospira interrogans]
MEEIEMSDPLLGTNLPEISLESTEGKRVKLPEDIQGSWTLLYFYPKDDTPGCTKQACNYRDNMGEFKKIGAKVYGISLDALDSHGQFIQKYSLNFPLLSDPDHKLSEALGVYGDQEWKGKVFKGLSRDSFLVSPDGKIQKVWRKVDPTTTVQDTLQEISKSIV